MPAESHGQHSKHYANNALGQHWELTISQLSLAFRTKVQWNSIKKPFSRAWLTPGYFLQPNKSSCSQEDYHNHCALMWNYKLHWISNGPCA